MTKNTPEEQDLLLQAFRDVPFIGVDTNVPHDHEVSDTLAIRFLKDFIKKSDCSENYSAYFVEDVEQLRLVNNPLVAYLEAEKMWYSLILGDGKIRGIKLQGGAFLDIMLLEGTTDYLSQQIAGYEYTTVYFNGEPEMEFIDYAHSRCRSKSKYKPTLKFTKSTLERCSGRKLAAGLSYFTARSMSKDYWVTSLDYHEVMQEVGSGFKPRQLIII